MGETTSNIKGGTNKAIIWFLNRNTASEKGMTRYIPSNEAKTYNQDYSTQQGSHLNGKWNMEFLRLKKKVKRIYLHQASTARDEKETAIRRWREKEEDRYKG